MKGKILKLVSIVTVLCTIAGVFLPNYVKSAQAVVSNLSNTWHGIGNTGVFTVKVNGYSNLYCANGGAHLNNGTVLNDNGVSMYNASAVTNITAKPNAVSWILDNIYLTDVTDSNTQNAMKNNLKNVIKTYSNSKDSSGKSILASKVGVNSIDDNWINTAVDSLINDKTTLYATQQYALWHYVKNNNSAYNSAMQNSDGSYNAIPNAKADRKYYTALYVSLTALADQAQKNGYTSPNVGGKVNISLNNAGTIKTTIQSDGKTVLIGPYKLTNNNSSFSKSFSATVNSDNADKIETVDANGKAVNVSSKQDNFYVKITYNKGFVKGTKYNFKINVKISGYRTSATLLTAADNVSQPLISIKKEAINTNSAAEASYYEELTGNYSLELVKVDSTNTNTKLKGVTFKVKEGNNDAKDYGPTDSNGLVSIFKNRTITKEGVAEFTITEVNVGNNEYIKLKEQVKFYVTLSKTKDAYVASKVSFETNKDVGTKQVTLEDNSKVNVTATLSGNTVRITIPNKPDVKGKYSLILEKVDSTNPNIKLQGVTFKVKEGNNAAKSYGPTASNGTVTVVNNQEVKEKGVKEFTITEVNVGSNKYIKLKEEVKVYITITQSNNTLSATKVSFDKDKETKSKTVTLEDNSKVNVTAALSGSKVLITIPNKPTPEGKYSLVLEKVSSKDSSKKISGVTFKVKEGNNAAKSYGPTASNGTVTVVNNQEVKEKGVKEFTITEVNVGSNKYIKLKDEVKVYITITESNNVFSATKVSFDKDKEVKSKEVTLEDNSKTTITTRISGSTVFVTIPNKPDIEGKYSLILEKVDSKDQNKKISGVTFKVQEGSAEAKSYGPTQEDGTVTVVKDKVVKEEGLYSYTITEIDVGNNEYVKLQDEVKAYIKISESNNTLVASKVSFNRNVELTYKEVKLEDGTTVKVTAKIVDGKVIITIPNKQTIKGKYSLELEKVDSEDKAKKLEGVTFNVKYGKDEKTYGPTDSNGIVSIVKNKEVKEEGIEEYTISEVNVGKNNYITLKDSIKLYIKIVKTDTAYVPSKVSFDKDQDIATKEVELQDGTKVKLTSQISGNTVKITIPNKKAIFDLALRKYITKINSQDLQNSREPVIRLKDATAILKYGTALYNNPKDPVKVKEGDTVTYKIRIYNEGNVDGYAKEITDYLPNGLEFVENSEINKANGWVATKNEDGTTTVKTKKLADTVIKASNGAEGYQKLATGLNKSDENWVNFWQDVEIECKVKENIVKEQKLVNVAEITNYGYMDGDNFIVADKKDVDRDSEQDNVFGENGKNQKSIDDYYESQYNKKNNNNNTEKQSDNKDNNNTEDQENNKEDNNTEKQDDNKNNNNTENQNENNNNTESQNDDKIDNYPGRQDDDDFENLIVEPDSREFKFVLNKVDEQGNPLIGADFTVKREKDNTSEVLLNNEEVKGTYEVLENKVQVNKTYTYRVIEVESAPEYVNVMEGKYITLKVYMNEQKELVLGNYEKVEEDYLINKYGFIINNENGTIVKENETDLYEKIKVKVNNQVSPAKVEITIPNALAPKDFDLALRKFITEIRTNVGSKQEAKQQITNRVPVFKVDEKGNYTYEHTKEPLMVVNDNVVVYTLRVYNEGEVDGYAKEIKDDIPDGLEFLPQYGLNEEYRWKMLDKYGKETTEVENAVSIVSDYLSKEQEEVAGENLIKAFDTEKYKAGEIKEPYYRDVKVAFKVNTDPKSEEVIINQAQISDDSDADGNEVEDKDSTPNKWVEGEDDQDIEKVKVQYFDLALRKWVTKAIVIEDGNQTVTETGHKAEDDPEEIVKVDLNKSKISDVTVKFGYSIRVSNEGKIAGYAKEISDYIPEGLKFVKEDNPDWEEVEGKVVTTKLEDTLLQPGETAEVQIILTWINAEDNMGLKQNVAEISKDYNEYGAPDIDSIPNNKVPGEDDIDDAPVMLTVKTGQAATYVGLILVILTVLAGGLVLIKKYVIK